MIEKERVVFMNDDIVVYFKVMNKWITWYTFKKYLFLEISHASLVFFKEIL